MSQQSNRFDAGSEEAKKFLNSSPKHRMRNFVQEMEKALDNPDKTPTPEARVRLIEMAEQANLEQQTLDARHQERHQVDDAFTSMPLQANSMSLTVPPMDERKVGRPLEGKKPKIEKTFALDSDLHKRLVRISNMEGLRLDRKYSVSSIMQHLLLFALEHVEDEKVIPGPDGFGLTLREGTRS